MFSQVGQANQDIIMESERPLVSLYGGANDEGLDIVHYRWLCEKISNGT